MNYTQHFFTLYNQVICLNKLCGILVNDIQYLKAGANIDRLSKSKKKDKDTKLLKLLRVNEEVIIAVRLEESVAAKCITTFDGEYFTVVECEYISSLIGMKSLTPDKILYIYYELLEKGDHIHYDRPNSTIWNSCFVRRKGKVISFKRLYKKMKEKAEE